jgi:hypothetical protein
MLDTSSYFPYALYNAAEVESGIRLTQVWTPNLLYLS